VLICPQLIASVEAQVKAQGLSDNKAPQNSLGGGLSCEAWTIAKRCHGMVAWELPRRMYHRCRGLGGQKRTPWRWMVLERDHTLLATPKSVRCWQQGLWVVLERDHTLPSNFKISSMLATRTLGSARARSYAPSNFKISLCYLQHGFLYYWHHDDYLLRSSVHK
jgi:hypothetical protein